MVFDSTIRRTMRPDQPEWLVSLQNDLALITSQAAQQYWPGPTPHSSPYFNYRLEHVQQVEREAFQIYAALAAQGLSPDRDIVQAIVWIHDRYHPQYDGNEHAAQAAAWARENLKRYQFPAEKIESVAYGVEHHSDPPGVLPESALEARLVWDADKLCKLGPLNVINGLMAQPAFPEQRVTLASLALLGLEKLVRARRLVNQFYFEFSRTRARERYTQQKAFFEMLARDVEA